MLDTAEAAPNRRMVLRGIAGALAGTALAPYMRGVYGAGTPVSTPILDGLTLVSGAGGNVLVLSTDAGQVVVDSGAAPFADDLLATLAELPGVGAAAVFNTHWHPDQVGANARLGDAGAKIYAHEKTRQRLSSGYYLPTQDRYQPPLAPAGRPTETIHATGSTRVGDQRIEFGHMIEAHTDGDMYVWFPDLDVIATGDVLSPVRDPVLDWFGGGWLGGRVDSLALLLELSGEDTRFVPSYGPVVGRAEVQIEHDMMLQFFELMVEHVRLGESAEDMLELGLLDQLGRSFEDPYRLLYDTHKGFWAHHNKLMPDIL